MSPHYSVYTVLQASRRSWRIGQTKSVKVYYFAYADTIQTDALYLVAAKVAAAQRVNGDTVSDDSLAELDSVTGSDIVSTLARIVTGDVQINSQSLQQAFAEANMGLRQANTIIGEYSMVDEAEDEDPIIIDVPLTPLSNPQQQSLFLGKGHASNGNSASNDRNENYPQPNGNGHSRMIGNKSKHEVDEKRQFVPRPRLFSV